VVLRQGIKKSGPQLHASRNHLYFRNQEFYGQTDASIRFAASNKLKCAVEWNSKPGLTACMARFKNRVNWGLIGDVIAYTVAGSSDGAKWMEPLDSGRRIGVTILWKELLVALGSIRGPGYYIYGI